MFIKQISVFIENKPGRLAEVTKYLADAGINILAISMADTTDFGILRLIVEDPGKTDVTLKAHSLAVKTTDVIAVAMENRPGSLAGILAELSNHEIGIEYMYAFTTRNTDHDSMVILRLNNQEDAVKKLENSQKIRMLTSEMVGQIRG
ncbi:MAG: ACT domain-containing protein [Clostridiales bacterium]|jgi:hypothetical protein|nr:ACT domain-containing protein [Clostridiales bacterium]